MCGLLSVLHQRLKTNTVEDQESASECVNAADRFVENVILMVAKKEG